MMFRFETDNLLWNNISEINIFSTFHFASLFGIYMAHAFHTLYLCSTATICNINIAILTWSHMKLSNLLNYAFYCFVVLRGHSTLVLDLKKNKVMVSRSLILVLN